MAIQSTNPPEVFALQEFKGLNQQARRASIDDQEEFWNENLFAIGPGNLRSLWGPSAPLYTAPSGTSILRIFTGYYGNDTPLFGQPPPGRKAFCMLSDGTADEVDLDSGLIRHLGNCWQPIAPKYWCSVKVWRPRWVGGQLGEVGGVVIGSPAGLYAWDGYQLYVPGGPAPLWLTNADTNPYPGLTTMPMPADTPGIYAMEIYDNRLWLAGKDVISFSMPGNGADFTTSDGGGFIAYFGSYLVHDYYDLAASGNYLFCFGDSSIDVISNVQMQGGTEGSPAITNFNYANVDPQIGQSFPRPVGRWDQFFVMFNGAGIYDLEGNFARQIGQKITNVWVTLDTSQYYPTMCAATIFGQRVMLVNGLFVDTQGVKRNLILMWHGTFWSVASQWASGTQLNLTNIVSYEDNSFINAYGTDGSKLYKLFARPDPNQPKRLSTKALSGTKPEAMLTIKNFKRIFLEVHDNDGRGVSFTGVCSTFGGGVPNGTETLGFEVSAGAKYGLEPWPLSCMGTNAAIDLESLSPDFTIERLFLMNEGRTLFGA